MTRPLLRARLVCGPAAIKLCARSTGVACASTVGSGETGNYCNREVTIPHGMRMLEEHGNLDNLRMAAGKLEGEYHGPLFMDSDVYKLLEAIGWERQHGAAADQERFLEEAGALLGAAQLPDGYLNSYYQVVEPSKRFANPAMGHELYCAGHLFQAAVAEARSLSAGASNALAGIGGAPSGQRHIGPVADRFAACLLKELPARPAFVPGHPEIETAMAEMYRLTGSEPLLQMAAELLGRRGRSSLSFGSFAPEYFQDDIEVGEGRGRAGPRCQGTVPAERGGGRLHGNGPPGITRLLSFPVGRHGERQNVPDRGSWLAP